MVLYIIITYLMLISCSTNNGTLMKSNQLTQKEFKGAINLFTLSYKLHNQNRNISNNEILSQIPKDNRFQSLSNINGKRQKCKNRKNNDFKFLKINRTKNNEKTYLCIFCSKTYLYKSSLNAHLKFHRGELDFECGFCFRKFVHNSKLQTHINIKHNKSKDYECRNCLKCFDSKYSLEMHQEKHSVSPNYECIICNSKFKIRNKLISHFKKNHNIFIKYKQYYLNL
ncbi:MAG: hypothetical protein GY830_05630 [Bacteroidetes bacterium]|nr:hypothetical protein [Bacteroidota bacterium]